MDINNLPDILSGSTQGGGGHRRSKSKRLSRRSKSKRRSRR